MSVIFFAVRARVCGSVGFFSSFYYPYIGAFVCMGLFASVGVAARSLCPGIVKNVVLDSSCAANE